MNAPVQRDFLAEVTHRKAQLATLRALLSTGQKYSTPELTRLVGSRFGGRLLELRRGADGHPRMDVRVTRGNGKGSVFWYQAVGELIAPEQLEAEKAKHLKRLRARIARLQAQESALVASMGEVSP